MPLVRKLGDHGIDRRQHSPDAEAREYPPDRQSYTPLPGVAMLIPTVMTARQPSSVRRRPTYPRPLPRTSSPNPCEQFHGQHDASAARSIPHSAQFPEKRN